MFFDTFSNQQDRFHSIASVCIRAGATCVRLSQNDIILDTYPADGVPKDPSLVSSLESGLTIQVYGLSGEFWQAIAETMLELFSSILNNEAELESLTAALVETQDRLVALYDLSKATHQPLESPALFDLLVSESCRLLDVEGAFAILIQSGQPVIIRQVGPVPLPEEQIYAAADVYRSTPRQNIIKNSDLLPANLRNMLIVSIQVRDDIFAAMGVYNKASDFTSPDIKLAKALAGQTGAKIENAMLVQEALARTRLETEMRLANQVQTALLPQKLPSFPGTDLYATSSPALEVGGDFFDIVSLPGQPLIFLVGDVTGKGMPAALLMSMTRTVARSAARNMPFTEPHQLMRRLNADLLDDFSTVGMFTTAFIGIFDRTTLGLSFCNAGQSPILYIPVNGSPVMLEAHDIPVGIFDGYDYTSHSLAVSPGDVFVVATDGFPESRDPGGEMFGYERLLDFFGTVRQKSAREMSEMLFATINLFSGNHPQDDDRTLIILKII